MLKGFLPAWDLVRRRVDVDPFVAWCLAQLQTRGIRVRSLAHLHEVIGVDDALACSEALTVASRSPAPRALMRAMVRAAIAEVPAAAVAVQACGHFRVLLPGDTRAPVQTHTDAAIGHQLDERTLWFALTDARQTAALHAADLASSWDAERTRRLDAGICIDDDAAPLRAQDVHAGDVLLFTPLHVHGARTNRETTTRVSIDIRVAPLGAARARNPHVWFPLHDARAPVCPPET